LRWLSIRIIEMKKVGTLVRVGASNASRLGKVFNFPQSLKTPQLSSLPIGNTHMVRLASLPNFNISFARKFSSALSTHKDAFNNNESTPFDFTAENYQIAKKIMAKYPSNYQRGACIPLLDLAQRQCGGWLPLAAMNKVAKILDMAPINVYEVASFYTMFNRTPVGKYHVQVCTTTPCMLRDAYTILDTCKKVLGIDVGETTKDGIITLGEVECAGACVNAPLLSINDDYYEDLTVETTTKLLEALKNGQILEPGPQNGRFTCEPVKGRTTLLETPPSPGQFVRPDL